MPLTCWGGSRISGMFKNIGILLSVATSLFAQPYLTDWNAFVDQFATLMPSTSGSGNARFFVLPSQVSGTVTWIGTIKSKQTASDGPWWTIAMPTRTVSWGSNGNVTFDQIGVFPTASQAAPWQAAAIGTKVKFRGRLNGAYFLLLGSGGWVWSGNTNDGELVEVNPQEPPSGPVTQSQNPMLQAFDNRRALSAGTWLQIFGGNLSSVTREWAGSDFNGNNAPTSLSGVSVKVNGKNAFVSYISPTQINAQAPDDDAVGPVNVEVTNSLGSTRLTINKTKVSPALLENAVFVSAGRKYVVALHQDVQTTFVGPANLIAGVRFRPAKPGDVITLYAVGCGAPGGQVISGLRQIALPYQVRFGSTIAQTQGFFAPGAVGLCQFNVTVPNIGNGDSAIDLIVDGVAADQNLLTTIQQ